MVVTAFGAASAAGARMMLKEGGNAVDAACAAAWALAVCEPAESGLGGQTTMLIHLADGRCVVVDGHSRAPEQLRRAMVGRRAQRQGFRSVAIPSTVRTLGEAQRRFGRLPLEHAIAPAIELAEGGYQITRLQRRQQKWTVEQLKRSPDAARLFLGPEGQVHAVGALFRQPVLARTLRRIAAAGCDDFYHGELARDLIADMQEHGGLIELTDLEELRLPVLREPLFIDYRGRRVLSIPPPGGGTQVLLALQVLSQLGERWESGAAWRESLISATLGAFRERERWPDHPADMTPSLAKWLVSAERAERLAKEIVSGRTPPPVQDSMGESGNTTHLCAADPDGNVVSLTQSIQSVFGAKVVNARLGFVYNNYLSTCPRMTHPYRLGPGCLPQSNAAPTIVLAPVSTSAGARSASGYRPQLAIGSAGSRRIVSSVVGVISAVIDRGLSLGEAVAMPRTHPLLNGKLWVEAGAMSEADLARLGRKFRAVRVLSSASYKLGAVQAIAFDAGSMHGVADPRRDGDAAGC